MASVRDLRGEVIKPGHTVVVANKNLEGPVMRIGEVVPIVKMYNRKYRAGQLFVKVKYGPGSYGGTEYYGKRIVVLDK